MIHAHTDPMARKNLVVKLMDLPTQTVPALISDMAYW